MSDSTDFDSIRILLEGAGEHITELIEEKARVDEMANADLLNALLTSKTSIIKALKYLGDARKIARRAA